MSQNLNFAIEELEELEVPWGWNNGWAVAAAIGVAALIT